MGCLNSKTKVVETSDEDLQALADGKNKSKDKDLKQKSKSKDDIALSPKSPKETTDESGKPPVVPGQAFSDGRPASADKKPGSTSPSPSNDNSQGKNKPADAAAERQSSRPGSAKDTAAAAENDKAGARQDNTPVVPAVASSTAAGKGADAAAAAGTVLPRTKAKPETDPKAQQGKETKGKRNSATLALPGALPGQAPHSPGQAAAPPDTSRRKGMFEIVDVDENAFKSTMKRGGRVPLPLQNRLVNRAATPLDKDSLLQRMENANKKREEEREKRRKAAAVDVQRVEESRESLRALEEKKAAELRRMIQDKVKVAENNRESTIDVVRLKKEGRNKQVKKAGERAKVETKPGKLLGDLPPIGRCLLAPEVPELAAKPAIDAHPSLPLPPSGAPSPRTPASISGLISPAGDVQGRAPAPLPQPQDIAKAVEAKAVPEQTTSS